MKYVGSKNRLAKDLVPIIQSYITDETEGYLEPFVGGANMIDKIKHHNKIGYDIHEYLIELLKSLSNGWLPPKSVYEEEYKDMQKNKSRYDKDLLGYVGFQLSYGSKWFGGYRRDSVGKRDYSKEAYNNVVKQAPNLKGIQFDRRDFRTVDDIKGYVIYCDIPYKDTTKYSVDDFPYEEFYNWAVKMSKNNIVLVSEYNMPDDRFECIWQKEHKVLIDSNRDSNSEENIRIEKLFIVRKDV